MKIALLQMTAGVDPEANGDVQLANAAAPSLQRYEATPFASVALKVMFCVVVTFVSGVGAALTVRTGAVWSTVMTVVPTATLPALSVASTVIVLTPLTSVPVANGDVQAAKAAAPSLQR